MNGCAPDLALIERLKVTRKWAIGQFLVVVVGILNVTPMSLHINSIIIHQIHCQKSDWSRAFNHAIHNSL